MARRPSSDPRDLERARVTLDALAEVVAAEDGSETRKLQDLPRDPICSALIEALAERVERETELRERAERAEVRVRQQAEKLERLRREARTDPLTRLPNRRAFDRMLARRLAEFQRFGTPSSLLLIDIDRFKATNDLYGHSAGDRVLVEVAGVLRATLRDMDFIGRWGGDEFVVVLPGTDLSGAGRAALRLQAMAAAIEIRHEAITIPVQVSVGATELLAGDSETMVVARADDALRHAKTRSGVSLHGGEGCSRMPAGAHADTLRGVHRDHADAATRARSAPRAAPAPHDRDRSAAPRK